MWFRAGSSSQPNASDSGVRDPNTTLSKIVRSHWEFSSAHLEVKQLITLILPRRDRHRSDKFSGRLWLPPAAAKGRNRNCDPHLKPTPTLNSGMAVVQGSSGFRKRLLRAEDDNHLSVLSLGRAAHGWPNKSRDSPSMNYSTHGLLLPSDMLILLSRENSPCIINNDCLLLIQPRTNKTI